MNFKGVCGLMKQKARNKSQKKSNTDASHFHKMKSIDFLKLDNNSVLNAISLFLVETEHLFIEMLINMLSKDV
ncbi:hypothetical protein E2320_017550, partial [Naja naja]